MPDVLRERKNDKIPLHNELLDRVTLSLVPGALQKLHVSIDRDRSLTCVTNDPDGFLVSAFGPDEDIRIKYHDTARLAARPSPF